MRRRRRSPSPLHRRSRLAAAAVAVAGAVVTALLTVESFSGSATGLCPTEGCNLVLSSPYARVFGLPLSLFGFLAYVAMAGFALAPRAIADDRKNLRDRVEAGSGWLLLLGGLAMTVFSGYLMYLLAFEIRQVCPYCIASAIFSVLLLVLAALSRAWEDLGQLLFYGIIVTVLVLLSVFGLYATAGGGGMASSSGSGRTGPPVTAKSGPAEIALAQHLSSIDAREYGAYWCPHCYDQKQLFGREAAAQLPYVECDPDGRNAQPDRCREAGIRSYPTWEIEGQLYPGVQPLERLAELSDYAGATNFGSNR